MIYTELKDKVVIGLTGNDAHKFLNGLVTNYIEQNSISYALMLSPQGRYICDFFIYPLHDGYLLEVPLLAKESVLSKLLMYKMRSNVDIVDVSSDYLCLYCDQRYGDLSYPDPRYGKLKYKSIIPVGQKDDLIKHELMLEQYRLDKYKYSIPDGHIDLLINKSFPQEYGMDFLNAISYNKGCYVGQEVIARTKYRGVIRKKLYRIESSMALEHFAQGSKIMLGSQEIGALCSSYQSYGLGLLRQEDTLSSFASLEGIELRLSPAIWYGEC